MSTGSLMFGNRLKQIRTEKNMSLEELGQLLGTTKQVLSRYENGQREPKITTAAMYAERLGVDLYYFLDVRDKQRPQHLWTLLMVSSSNKGRVFNIDSKVAKWICDILDHSDKVEQVIKNHRPSDNGLAEAENLLEDRIIGKLNAADRRKLL